MNMVETPSVTHSPEKILVVRTSAIGDIVFASPFAAALRRTYPNAFIAWVVEPGIDELLQNNPHIDELIIWPKKEWQALIKKKSFRDLVHTMKAYAQKLKGYQFDWAIDLQSLLKSGILVKMTAAPRRIGLGSTEGSQFLMTEVIPKGGDIARISSEYLYIAKELQLEVGDFIPELFLPDAAIQQAQKIRDTHGLSQGQYAVIAPFTTRPQKHWFEDAWQDLIALLEKDHGLATVVLGGPTDKEAAQRIISKSSTAVSLAGKTSITETASMVSTAGLLIGVDTGVTHMSIAFNTPAVILFGSTCPYTHTCRDNAHVLWLGLSCSPCKRTPICSGSYPCMRYLTPARVSEEAQKVLTNRETKTVLNNE